MSNRVGNALRGYKGISSRVRSNPVNDKITYRRTPVPGAGLPSAPPSGYAAPQADQLPPDPAYDQVHGGLVKRRATALAGYDQQATAAGLDYGYSPSYDDSGNASGVAFNPNNPNSRAAQLKKRYREAEAGTRNGMASRGQLYSGAMAAGQDINADNYQRSDDANQKAFIGFLGRLQQGRTGAQNDFEVDDGSAMGDRVGRAAQNPLYNPDTSVTRTDSGQPSGVDLSKWVQTTWKGSQAGRRGTFRRYGNGRVEFTPGG